MDKLVTYVILLLMAATLAAGNPGCPIPECDCVITADKKVEINCRGKGFTTTPQFNSTQVTISEHYSSLILDNNDIRTIPAGAFRQFRIKRLSIQNNPIAELNDESFHGLEPYLESLSITVDKAKTVKFPWKQAKQFHKLKELHLNGFIMPRLHKNTMNGTVLEKLSLESCHVEFIEDGAFFGVHPTLKELSLKENMLTTAPMYAMWKLKRLKRLALNNNRIEKIVGFTFLYLHDLAELDLSQNHINSIEIDAFNGLGHLEYLGLNMNFLTIESLHCLESLVNLEQLNLAMNNIDAIPIGVFSKLTKLAYLNLQENVIEKISKNLLHGTHNQLTVLLLSDNKISEIKPKTFEDFKRLETLYLDGNPLSNGLHNDSFIGLEKTLKSLFLERTGFSGNSWHTIHILQELVVLNLCENGIKELPSHSFHGMENLGHLSLCLNQIEHISQSTFYGLDKSMKSIDLSSNRIRKIPQCTFYRFAMLDTLNLAGNPLQCDCHLSWLRLWVSKKTKPDQMSIDWRCNTPELNQGQLFREVLPYNFRCNHTGLDHDHKLMCKQPASVSNTVLKKTFLPDLNTVEKIKFSQIGRTSIYLHWDMKPRKNVNFLRVYHQVIGNKDFIKSVPLDPSTRDYVLTNLEPKTEYTVCIHVDTEDGFYLQWPNCRTVQTNDGEAAPVSQLGKNKQPDMLVIAGCTAGVILILIIILTSVILYVRHRTKEVDSSKLSIVTRELDTSLESSRLFKSSRTPSTDSVLHVNATVPPYVIDAACKKRIFLSEANLTKNEVFRNSTMPPRATSQQGPVHHSSQKSIRFVHDPLPPVPPHMQLKTVSACVEKGAGVYGPGSTHSMDSQCSTHFYDEIPIDNESAYGTYAANLSGNKASYDLAYASTDLSSYGVHLSSNHSNYSNYDLAAGYDNDVKIEYDNQSVHL